ncbi:MAG: DUF2934 domain-containing protein [Thiobacillus sp.]|nr:DUF2934 domain-containing protein [Thiobacillus sp.]
MAAEKPAKAPAAVKAAPAKAAPAKAKKAAKAEPAMEKPRAASAEERQHWIAIAAYHRAERRGFVPGYDKQDWLDAEAEIDAMIGKA